MLGTDRLNEFDVPRINVFEVPSAMVQSFENISTRLAYVVGKS